MRQAEGHADRGAGKQPVHCNLCSLTASRHSRGNSRWSPPAAAAEPLLSSRMGRDTAGFSNQKRCRVLLQHQRAAEDSRRSSGAG
jgi:hypothetical protein